jgi:predicted nuclease with RNAse H fold
MACLVIGVDLGASFKRATTAVAEMVPHSGGLPRLRGEPWKTTRDDGIIDALPPPDDVIVVAIDCPLSRPSKGKFFRDSELRLQRNRVSIFPSGSPVHSDWVTLGVDLARQLLAGGYRCVEVYPYASRKGLSIGVRKGTIGDKHVQRDRQIIQDDLRSFIDFGSALPKTTWDHDKLDAVISSLTGFLWTTHDRRIVELSESPPFIVPASILAK